MVATPTEIFESNSRYHGISTRTRIGDSNSRYTIGVKPFRRLFARTADVWLLGAPTAVIVSLRAIHFIPGTAELIALVHEQSAIGTRFIGSFLSLAATSVLTATMLSTWGTTPGKKVFGVEVSKEGS